MLRRHHHQPLFLIPTVLFALASLLVPPRDAAASPITWHYAGSVTPLPGYPSSGGPVALGTPVTFTVTVDPEANVLAGGTHPDFIGAYQAIVYATVGGVGTYYLFGYLEVNDDPLAPWCPPCSPQGSVYFRQQYFQEPSGLGYAGGSQYGFAYVPEGIVADPSSGALPLLRTFNLMFPLLDVDSGLVYMTGVSGALVPEPSTLLLLGSGLAAVAARRRFTKRT